MDASYDSTTYHRSVRGDDMEGMLREAFNIHNHGLESFPTDFMASDDCNLGGNAFTELERNKMPRRKILRGSIVQNDPNSTETNSTEQQTAIGSSNVPITPEDPTEVQTKNGGTRRGRGRTLLRELYELDPVECVKVGRNSFGQPVGSEARLLA
ncbi:hypothetical protein GOBAR_DD12761 [Gossypium barbadense]|nr:hypothetical protein GOBAR_DD12761 [Gossypium barbadense]